jgi:glutamyl-tRNA synthetase
MRTRFAPSPTGDLHIGGVRTALFNYLLAKQQSGIFLLRIEDTDTERSTQASIDVILQGMNWLGLQWDEGPIHQMARLERYQKIADELIAKGHAYRCDCSPERLASVRSQQLLQKQKTRYDGHCRARKIDADVEHVVRFKTPLEGDITFHDQIRGDITINNSELDDVVLLRQDGVPTYNFSVVVDDYDMEVSLVLRGDDHINNTPRQINIYNALAWKPPQYAHVPMILGEDGKRLSKRHGATNVLDYRDMGYLPDAVLNYLVRLGWSHGDQEIFSREDMINDFDLEHISHSPAILSKDKLDWLNQHYMKEMPIAELAAIAKPFFAAQDYDLAAGPDLEQLVALYVERAKTLKEMAEQCSFFYQTPEVDVDAAEKLKAEHAAQVLAVAKEHFVALGDWHPETIKATVKAICDSLGMKMGQVGPVLRVATTGTMQSPALDQTLWLLGKEVTLSRLNG